MSNINLTAALRSNLLTLQKTNEQIGKTQNILATGLKVNSALDDPTAFFAAQALNNRASDLSALLDSIGQSISTIQAADKGITSITTLVNQLKSVAQSAKDGASGQAKAVIYSEDITAANMSDPSTPLAGGAFDANVDFVVSVNGGGGQNVDFVANDDVFQIATKLDALNGISASVVAGETAGTYRIKIEADNEGETITITDGDSTVADFGFYSYAADGTTHTSVTTAVAVQPGSGGPADQTQLETDYDSIRTQIDQLVADANYRGTNLLSGSGSLITTFNEDGSSSLSIASVDRTVVGLGINAADFSSTTNISAALADIDAALATLRATSKSFGNNLSIIQNRETFTKNLINELQNGSGKLTLADKNEEGAKLLALQTAEQLGIQALALASQSNQSVLRLFS